MARYIIIYDDQDAIERTIFFEGSLKALRDSWTRSSRQRPRAASLRSGLR